MLSGPKGTFMGTAVECRERHCRESDGKSRAKSHGGNTVDPVGPMGLRGIAQKHAGFHLASCGILRGPAGSCGTHQFVSREMLCDAAAGSNATHNTPTGASGILLELPRSATKNGNIVEHREEPFYDLKSATSLVLASM